MVTVPTQKTQSVSVNAAPAGYQSTSVPKGAFGSDGSGLIQGGREVGSFSDKMYNLAIEMQREDNDTEAKEAENLIDEIHSKAMFGDGTEENIGYYGYEQKSAIDNYSATEDSWKSKVADVINGSSNEHVKKRLQEYGDKRALMTLEGMTKHANTQRVKYNDAVSEARKAKSFQSSSQNYNDSKFLDEAIATATAEVDDFARRHSVSPEAKDVMALKEVSAMVKGTFDAAVAADDITSARRIITKYRGKVDGVILSAMEKSIDAVETKDKARSAASSLQLKYPGDIAKQVEEARKIGDIDVSDETIRRLDNDHAREVRLEAEAKKEATTEAWKVVKSGGGLDALKPEVLDKLDGTTVSSMMAFEKRLAENGTGLASVTNPSAYNELTRKQMDDPEGFVRMNILEEFGSKLDTNDFEYFVRQQQQMNTREQRDARKEATRNANYTMADRMAREYMDAAKIKYGKNGKGEDPAKAKQIYSAVRLVVDDATEEGRKVERKELEQVLSSMFLSGELQGSGIVFDDKGRAFEFFGRTDGSFEITHVEDQKADISKATGVPVGYVVDIAKAIKSRNKMVTIEEIVNTYNNFLAGEGK